MGAMEQPIRLCQRQGSAGVSSAGSEIDSRVATDGPRQELGLNGLAKREDLVRVNAASGRTRAPRLG